MDGLANANILLDHNTHLGINSPSGAPNSRIGLYWGSSTLSGVTISNSLFKGGDCRRRAHRRRREHHRQRVPGHLRTPGATTPTTSSTRARRAASYAATTSAPPATRRASRATTAAPSASRSRTTSSTCAAPGASNWYSDRNSLIRHNTLRYYAPGCYGGSACGLIDINRKSADPAGTGTVVVDNVATGISVQNGSSVGERHHNLLRQGAATGDSIGTPVFQGGTARLVVRLQA